MIPRLSVAGTACLAFLFGFEQILCFAAAAPAPRIEERPRHYFPKNVKRIVTNGTNSPSYSQTTTTNLEVEKSTLESEELTQAPTSTLDQTSSHLLPLSPEFRHTSLVPPSYIRGLPFRKTPPVGLASPSSAESPSPIVVSIDPNTVSVSVLPPEIAVPVSTLSLTQPLSDVSASSSPSSAPTTSTVLSSSGVSDLHDGTVSSSADVVSHQSGAQSLSSGSEAQLVQTVSSQGSSQTSAEPASTSQTPASSQTSSSSVTKLAEELSKAPPSASESVRLSAISSLSDSKTPPSASESVRLSAVSSLSDSKTSTATSEDSDFRVVPSITLSSLKTGATELGISVTAPLTTVPTISGTLGPSQSLSGDSLVTKSTAADRTRIGFAENGNHDTASSRTEPAEKTFGRQPERLTSVKSGTATEPSRGGLATEALTTSSTQSTPAINSSAVGAFEEDQTDAGRSVSSTEISFALFGANTIFFSTSKPTLSASVVSSQVSPHESATGGRNTIATKSSGSDITVSGTLARNTNIPESSGFPHSTKGSESVASRTTVALSSVTPEQTGGFKGTSVEPELSASISRGVNGSAAGISPEESNTGKRPDVDLSDFDDLVTLGTTASAGVSATRTTETPQRSSSELSVSETVSTRASASVGAGISEETRSVKRSEYLYGSGGSFRAGATAPITATLKVTTSTVGGKSSVQSESGASVSTGQSASSPATKSKELDGTLSSDLLPAKPTIATSGGVAFPTLVITSGQSELATASTPTGPKPTGSDSASLASLSSIRSLAHQKYILAAFSKSIASEQNILASSSLRISVSVSQTIIGQSEVPKPTLTDPLGTTASVSESAKPSRTGSDALGQESNRTGSETSGGTIASSSRSSALISSSQIGGSLPRESGQPSLGPVSADISKTTGLSSTKASSVEAPEATESSALPSAGSQLASSGSEITSRRVSTAVASNTSPSVPEQTDSISKTSASSADRDGSSIVPTSVVGLPPSSSTVRTGSIRAASTITTDQDGSQILSNSAIGVSLSVKPSFTSQTDAFIEKPAQSSGFTPSTARSQPQISESSVTHLANFAQPTTTGTTSLSTARTPQTSDGSPILIPGATNLPSSIAPSLASQPNASPPKTSQLSDSLPTLLPGSTDLSASTEASRATQTGTATAKAPQLTGEPLSTDLPLLTESSGAIQTGSYTNKAPSSPASFVTGNAPASPASLASDKGSPSPVSSVTDKASPFPASLATDLSSSVPSPSVTDLLPVKEPPRTTQTDLNSEKPALPSDLSGGLSAPVPSLTNASPPTGPSLTRQTLSPSASEILGEPQPSNASPIPISIKSGAATATEGTPPVVISPTPSLPIVSPSQSVPASQTDNTNLFTTALPVVPTGPTTSRVIPVEPSITAPNDQVTNGKPIITSSTGSQTGLPVVIPTSVSPPLLSSEYVASPVSSGTLGGLPITASPAVSLTTREPAESITNVPPVVLSQPSGTPIVSPPISIDQSTLVAPVTSKDSEIPASSGGAPSIIILPSSALGSETSRGAASAPTGTQLLASATPGASSATASVSTGPVLVGLTTILTPSSSNPAISAYSSASQPGSTRAAPSSGVTVEPSGVSPSGSGVPTGALVGSASVTIVSSVSSNPAVAASYSSIASTAEGSRATGIQAALVTSGVQTSGYLPSGGVSVASSVETSKSVPGSEVTGSPSVPAPVKGSVQSTGTYGGSTTPGPHLISEQSTGTTKGTSGAASVTDVGGTQPSSAIVSVSSSSVPGDAGSVIPGSTASVLPPSAAVSSPSTITPAKEGPKTELVIQSGSNIASPTATDTLTAQPIGSSILAEPSASMPTATTGLPTGIPSSVPRIISPPNGVPAPPDNTTLCQIGFLYPLNYKFVLQHEQSQRQIFKYLPQGIADGLAIPLENVTMQTLRAYDTTQDLHYITTLAMFFIPSSQMDLLQLDLHTPAHKIYNNSNPSVKTIMSMINPAIPLKGDNSLGTPMAPGNGKDDPSTSSNSDPGNEGVPISGVDNSSPVRAKSVGIAAGVVCGAAAYGAAMFFVARRYRKRKQSHGRSPSMLSSPVLSGTSHDYTVVANTALMSGGRGDGDRSLTPHNGYYYERNSRGSGHSGSTGRQQISAPVMAENSLGWN